jgi:hypothetical protein
MKLSLCGKLNVGMNKREEPRIKGIGDFDVSHFGAVMSGVEV